MRALKKKQITERVVQYAILILITIVILFPIYMMVSMALFSREDIDTVPRRFFPSQITVSNFVEAFKIAGNYIDDFGNVGLPYMVLYIKNTLIVLVVFVVGCVIMSSITAYAFAKVNFAKKNLIFFLMLSTMMIPGSVTIIPMFIVFKHLHFLDTLLPLCVPIWFGGGAINIFLLRQFMRGIPNEMLESAALDGASHLRRCFMIVMPMCKPVLGYIAMSSVFSVWNDFFSPLLYVNEKSKWTLALGIANIVQTNDSGLASQKQLLMAACTVMSAIPVIIFIFGQKLFMENLSFTGLKE